MPASGFSYDPSLWSSQEFKEIELFDYSKLDFVSLHKTQYRQCGISALHFKILKPKGKEWDNRKLDQECFGFFWLVNL